MDTRQSELSTLLLNSERIIRWSISLVPSSRLSQPPPHRQHPRSDKGFKTYFGDWSALRILYHVVYYEENYAIPGMRYFIDGNLPTADLIFPDSSIEEKVFERSQMSGTDVAALLDTLHDLRQLQVSLISDMTMETWGHESLQTGLGLISPEFIVAKTIQHSMEHVNDILKNALYWERALQWLDGQVDC